MTERGVVSHLIVVVLGVAISLIVLLILREPAVGAAPHFYSMRQHTQRQQNGPTKLKSPAPSRDFVATAAISILCYHSLNQRKRT